MEPTDQTISQIVAEVASALKDAAAEYGPEAAELALMAYRVDAIKTLLFIPVAALAIFLGWRAWFALKRSADKWEEEAAADVILLFGAVLGGGGALALVIESLIRAVDLPLWLAAFGNPELLIATRALQAAGLM